MKASLVALFLLMSSTAACSSDNCDDIGCTSRLELSVTFEEDGEWSLGFGTHGSCDVTVVSGRVDSASCSGSVTHSSSPDADTFLINATPKTVTITFTGVIDGTTTVTPQYEDQKADCSSGCQIAESQVDIGST